MGPEDETRKTRGEIITDYMSALVLLHTMCVAKSVKPYDVWGICLKFRTNFKKVYDLGLEISTTPKVHICLTHPLHQQLLQWRVSPWSHGNQEEQRQHKGVQGSGDNSG